MCAKLDALQTIPDQGRFGNVVKFIEGSFPLRELKHFYDDAAFIGCSNSSEDKAWIDLGHVSQYVMDDFNPMYALMVLCVGACWTELMFFGRSCLCHPTRRPDEHFVFSYFKRVKQYQEDSDCNNNCPFKGCVARELACGRAKLILKETLARYGRMLVTEIHGASAQQRNWILEDWDIGFDESI